MAAKRSVSAGERVVAEMDAALEAVSKQLGKPLSWTEHGAVALQAAARAADRRELLQRAFDDELGGQGRAAILTGSAELRLLEKSVAEHLGRVQVGPRPRRVLVISMRRTAAGLHATPAPDDGSR